MKNNPLVVDSKQFAIEIFYLCKRIRDNKKGNVLLNQLLRSGTAIGANIHEANYASSRADFINKMQIDLKECYEAEYWLDLFKNTGTISMMEYNRVITMCYKLRRLLTASVNTAKHNGTLQQE